MSCISFLSRGPPGLSISASSWWGSWFLAVALWAELTKKSSPKKRG